SVGQRRLWRIANHRQRLGPGGLFSLAAGYRGACRHSDDARSARGFLPWGAELSDAPRLVRSRAAVLRYDSPTTSRRRSRRATATDGDVAEGTVGDATSESWLRR